MGNDGAVKTEKLRAEKHLEGCERHVFQKAQWDLVLCPVSDLNQLDMGDCNFARDALHKRRLIFFQICPVQS